MALVTLDQAKTQCRLPLDSTEYDDDLNIKIEHATALVIDYIDRPYHEWEAGSPESGAGSPADLEFTLVQAAVMEVVENLFFNRGSNGAANGPITERVVNMLKRVRRPTLA